MSPVSERHGLLIDAPECTATSLSIIQKLIPSRQLKKKLELSDEKWTSNLHRKLHSDNLLLTRLSII